MAIYTDASSEAGEPFIAIQPHVEHDPWWKKNAYVLELKLIYHALKTFFKTKKWALENHVWQYYSHILC